MTKKRLITWILPVLMGVVPVAVAGAPTEAPQISLRDGFVLSGVDGTLRPAEANEATDRWFFEFDAPISGDKGKVAAGASLELLPSSALERMIADVNARAETSYRLWARVTKYKGKNFVFGVYFLGLGKMEPAQPSPSQEPSPKVEPTASEPNDALDIPKEVLEKLETKRIIRHEPVKDLLKLKQDFVLADRTAVLLKQTEGRLVFVLDALGRRAEQFSLRLLPCQALELTERRCSTDPGRIRFRIAGIVTEFKGKRYLLLQKATRVYSYGNFGQ